MKIADDKSKNFNPITLSITFESKRELELFWANFNVPHGVVYDYSDGKFSQSNVDYHVLIQKRNKLFDWVDEQLDKLED